MSDHKGYYTGIRLPHYDQADAIQSVTFRLADSLPRYVLERMAVEVQHLDESAQKEIRTRKIEQFLDMGMGSCVLKNRECAALVEGALLHFNGLRYDLKAWVIMPNHVHVCFSQRPGFRLPDVIHSWKRHTARQINLRMGKTGTLWDKEYWDRCIRDTRHLNSVIQYLEWNPVKARLVNAPEHWPWSSIHRREALQASP